MEKSDIKLMIERLALRHMFPGASPGRLKKLHALTKQKGVHIITVPNCPPDLNRLMVSIVRHDATQYDCAMSNGLCKESARGLISPIIRREMESMKG